MQEGEVDQQLENERALGNERESTGNTSVEEIDASVTATSASEAAMSSTLSDTITQVIAASLGTSCAAVSTSNAAGVLISTSETAAGTVDAESTQLDKAEDSDVGEDDADDEVRGFCSYSSSLSM